MFTFFHKKKKTRKMSLFYIKRVILHRWYRIFILYRICHSI